MLEKKKIVKGIKNSYLNQIISQLIAFSNLLAFVN